MIIWRMRIACWITNATDTHAEYVILIACPRQKLLRECASKFLHMYIAFLVAFNVGLSGVTDTYHFVLDVCGPNAKTSNANTRLIQKVSTISL